MLNTIDANAGQLFLSIGLMMGAHAESKHKADRIRETWIGRRNGGVGKSGVVSNTVPSWIVRTATGCQLDRAKVKIIRRIFRMVLTMGTLEIAKRLNDEKVPTLTSRKTSRGFSAWQHASISALIRGRQVLGEQQRGRMENDQRVLTGEVVQAYPAAVSEAEHAAANAALDARKRGVGTGRNRAAYTNLFGALAVCDACGGRMAIRAKGGRAPSHYLGCQNSADGHTACQNTKYYRVDHIERDLFARVG